MSSYAYGSITWLERVHMLVTILRLPVVAIYRLLISPLTERDRHKTWKRVLTDASFRFSSSSLRVNQIQALLGTDVDVYAKWVKRHKLPSTIETLDQNTSLMWLTQRSTEKVILYIHGGCYCLPMQDFAADYWKKTVDSINRIRPNGEEVGLVALNYSLIPNGNFPTQLKQMLLAIEYLLSQGIKAENIHIVGESAGGGLVLQLLSHMLHPFKDPSVTNMSPLQGIKLGSMCIMSPIVSLSTTSASYKANTDLDVLPSWSWGELFEYSEPFLKTSEAAAHYVEALTAPDGWFSSAEQVVGRIFISIGEYECMRDDVLTVMDKLPHTASGFLTKFMERRGVHNSQYLDCMAGQVGDLAAKIQRWMEESLV